MRSTKPPKKITVFSQRIPLKKAGSSNSKSKIKSTSKSSSAPKAKSKPPARKLKRGVAPSGLLEVQALAQTLAVGHHPRRTLSLQDEELYRAFQSNLLSLISHELKTPLMGILNALNILESGAGSFSVPELVAMARRNA